MTSPFPRASSSMLPYPGICGFATPVSWRTWYAGSRGEDKGLCLAGHHLADDFVSSETARVVPLQEDVPTESTRYGDGPIMETHERIRENENCRKPLSHLQSI